MATLKDVAKIACVDVSTVSRAINNASYVHPETKKRILFAIEEVGYKPSLIKQSLKKGKSKTIAVIVPNINLTIFTDIIKSIQVIARKYKYEVITCETWNDPDQEVELLNRLRDGLVDGIIIAATGENKTLIKDLKVSGIEIIQILRNDIKTISSVTANFYSSTYNAVNRLYNNGYRKIGLINGPTNLNPYYERYQGYHDAINEKRLIEIMSPNANLEADLVKEGYEATKYILKKVPDLEGLIVSLDLLGIGAIDAKDFFKKDLAKNLQIISTTGQSSLHMFSKDISTFNVPAHEIGKKSAKLIIDAIESPREKKTLKKIILDMKLNL